MSYKVTADYRCPPSSPFAVVDESTNLIVGPFYRTRQAAQQAMPADDVVQPVAAETRDADRTVRVVESRASTAPWNPMQSDYTPAQWKAACLVDRGTGDEDDKSRYALPVKEPNGAVNVNAVHAAAGRIHSLAGVGDDVKAKAARALVALYGQLRESPPDALRTLAGSAEPVENRSDRIGAELANGEQASDILERPLAPIELRAASVADVNFAQRIITTVAAPYEQGASVMGGQGFGRPGEIWQEVFCRSAFAGLTRATHRIKVNRDHDKQRTVGKVLEFRDEPSALLSDVKIARTGLGDETLELAAEGCLGASVGFAVRSTDQDLDRFTKTRRIRNAYLDHLSFVPDPAYVGAEVLSVRNAAGELSAPLTPAATPVLDEFLDDEVFRWAHDRLNRT